MLKMLPVCLTMLFLTSCAHDTPVINKPPMSRIVLSACVENINELPDDARIGDYRACDILTPFTARQILTVNRQIASEDF